MSSPKISRRSIPRAMTCWRSPGASNLGWRGMLYLFDTDFADYTAFGLNREGAKTAKGVLFFPDRGKTDQEKATPDYILARITLFTLFS